MDSDVREKHQREKDSSKRLKRGKPRERSWSQEIRLHGAREEIGETKLTKDEEDPDEGLITKEIMSRIREEKEPAGGGAQGQPN